MKSVPTNRSNPSDAQYRHDFTEDSVRATINLATESLNQRLAAKIDSILLAATHEVAQCILNRGTECDMNDAFTDYRIKLDMNVAGRQDANNDTSRIKREPEDVPRRRSGLRRSTSHVLDEDVSEDDEDRERIASTFQPLDGMSKRKISKDRSESSRHDRKHRRESRTQQEHRRRQKAIQPESDTESKSSRRTKTDEARSARRTRSRSPERFDRPLVIDSYKPRRGRPTLVDSYNRKQSQPLYVPPGSRPGGSEDILHKLALQSINDATMWRKNKRDFNQLVQNDGR